MKKENLSKSEREKLAQLLKLINEFRALDSEMQMQQAATLITVALNEGVALNELAERTQLAMSSASRNVASLSPVRKKGVAGHGLIISNEDPEERRRKLHTMTPKGVTFVRRLVEMVGA